MRESLRRTERGLFKGKWAAGSPGCCQPGQQDRYGKSSTGGLFTAVAKEVPFSGGWV